MIIKTAFNALTAAICWWKSSNTACGLTAFIKELISFICL